MPCQVNHQNAHSPENESETDAKIISRNWILETSREIKEQKEAEAPHRLQF